MAYTCLINRNRYIVDKRILLQWLVQQLKGYTSHELRKEFSHLKSRLPTLWTRSYYVESCGHISEQTIKRYIEEQKNK